MADSIEFKGEYMVARGDQVAIALNRKHVVTVERYPHSGVRVTLINDRFIEVDVEGGYDSILSWWTSGDLGR